MYILPKPVHAYSHRCCYMSPTVYALDFRGMLNKLANLEATLVRNSDRPTDGSKVSVWNWTILHILDCTLDITCHNVLCVVINILLLISNSCMHCTEKHTGKFAVCRPFKCPCCISQAVLTWLYTG